MRQLRVILRVLVATVALTLALDPIEASGAREAFGRADINGDEIISPYELQTYLEAASNTLADFYTADTNKDKHVTLEELHGFVNVGNDQDFYSTFIDEFDDNGDQKISLREWQKHHGYGEEAKKFMRRADYNEDGYLKEREFVLELTRKDTKSNDRIKELLETGISPQTVANIYQNWGHPRRADL
eukprot:g2597.t1